MGRNLLSVPQSEIHPWCALHVCKTSL